MSETHERGAVRSTVRTADFFGEKSFSLPRRLEEEETDRMRSLSFCCCDGERLENLAEIV